MNYIFRADSSNIIGSGHIYRSMRVADLLVKKKNKVNFITRNFDGNINSVLKKKYKTHILKDKIFNINKKKNYLMWNKYQQIKDANKTLKIAKKIKAEQVVVDHYGLSHHWHKTLSKHLKVIVIDDYLNKKIFSDVYINYHLLTKKYLKLRKIINPNCKILLGPKYALLDQVKIKKKNMLKKNILIYFGSIDSFNVTTVVINILNKIKINNLKFLIILGKNNKNKERIIKKYENNKNFIFYSKNFSNLVKFYTKCQGSITGAGVSLYEQIQHKLSILSIYSNNNQKQLVDNLSKLNICKSVSRKKITKGVIKNFIKLDRRKTTSKKIYFDGMGVNRIYQIIRNN